MPRSQRVYWQDEHNSMKTANAYITPRPILIIAACFSYTRLPTVRLTLVCKTDVFACVCSRWQCYSSHHRSQRMSYALLLRLLKTVEAEWEDTTVHGELVGFYNSSLTLNVWAQRPEITLGLSAFWCFTHCAAENLFLNQHFCSCFPVKCLWL